MEKKISVLINTLNEERNIENCLRSLSWADEIVLVDMKSEDNTIKIAKHFPVRIITIDRLGYVEPARQLGVSLTSNEWVLILDADEIVTKELSKKLIEIADKNIADVVWIPRKNYYFGKEMVGSGAGALQDLQLRFFKKNHVTFSDKIHSFPKIINNSIEIKLNDPDFALLHFTYITVEQFIDKINLYTTREAEFRFKNNINLSLLHSFLYFLKDGLFRFFFKNGIGDGKEGALICWILSCYYLIVKLKLLLMKKYNCINIDGQVHENYKIIIDKNLTPIP